MKEEFKQKYHHIYFLGIGGISMSGLAEILLQDGFAVSGSDMRISETTERLKQLGAVIHIGHTAENITPDINLLVYTAAVKQDNPELLAAKEKGIPVIDRAELLGTVMASYDKAIAISGTHGKTTTTSMLSEILLTAEKNPTISVGGILPSIGGNTRVGGNHLFVAEACEYFDSFLKFNPFIAIILNIEADHLDYFKDISHIRHSFHSYAKRVPKEGYVIINSAIDDLEELTEDLNCHVVTFGLTDSAMWTAKNITYDETGRADFDICCQGKCLGTIRLHIPGDHNILNALAACAAASLCGIEIAEAAKGLDKFFGVNRRFQTKGVKNGITVIDDYAHHPTEIKATLHAAAKLKHHKIICVFQPHTYTRTAALLEDFSNAFSDADTILVADIYAAREKDTGLIHARTLAEKIEKKGKNAVYVGGFSEILDYAEKICSQGDLLITMGAGDIYLVGEQFLER